MLFARRAPRTLGRRLQTSLWPQRGFVRSARYLYARLLRLPGSTQRAALGLAIGVFVATLPIPGVQLAAAIAIAWALRASLGAAIIGTFWANPITMPLLWLASYRAGCFMLGMDQSLSLDLERDFARLKLVLGISPAETLAFAGATLLPIFKPMLVGAMPFALFLAALSYYISRSVMDAARLRRPA